MAKPRKKRFKTALERIKERIDYLSAEHATWLDKARVASDFVDKSVARQRADECRSAINDLFRRRRKIEGGRKPDAQPKLF